MHSLARAALFAAAVADPATALEFELARVVAPDEVTLRVGIVERVAIEVVVRPGYHVQANPPAYPNLIPVTLTFAPASGVAVGKPIYPAPSRKRLQGSGEDLLVYGGRFRIVVPMGIYSGERAPIRLQGALRYQGCDDLRCLVPQTVPVAITVRAARP